MPFDVRVDAHVAKSPQTVAGYMFDPRHDPEWITGIEHVDPPEAPVAVGTETHRLARFMGRRIDYVLRSRSTSRTASWSWSRCGRRFRWALPTGSSRTDPDLESACE
jgi:hypothetical protein